MALYLFSLVCVIACVLGDTYVYIFYLGQMYGESFLFFLLNRQLVCYLKYFDVADGDTNQFELNYIRKTNIRTC